MDDNLKIVNLKKDNYFLKEYVILRNSYAELLLTKQITISETSEWLRKEDIEVRCLIDKNKLIGVVILYVNRKGEITFFAKEKGKGIGGKLLNIVEEIARERKLMSIWAWVLCSNIAAKKAFLKSEYILEAISKRKYNSKILKGLIFRKTIKQEF